MNANELIAALEAATTLEDFNAIFDKSNSTPDMTNEDAASLGMDPQENRLIGWLYANIWDLLGYDEFYKAIERYDELRGPQRYVYYSWETTSPDVFDEHLASQVVCNTLTFNDDNISEYLPIALPAMIRTGFASVRLTANS